MPEFNSLAAQNIMPIPDLNEIPNEGRNLDEEEEAWIYDDGNIKPIKNRTQELKHDELDPYKQSGCWHPNLWRCTWDEFAGG
ncbi:hypothetical protein Acr_26g0010260 [Actinidia rufa]|uniref:Uncharacterized protein n=1 Tax=Actinidia rufa TaxID=165716 RepID=A0A7J0H3S5_9ERIC|nr:hypothetical protein Acr_26g0010260 [Actinidia rufa]